MKGKIRRKSVEKHYSTSIIKFLNPGSFTSLCMVISLLSCLLSSCGEPESVSEGFLPEEGISPERTDKLILPEGFEQQVLITGFDTLNAQNVFGYDVSGIVYLGKDAENGTLWVNHELMNPMLATGYYGDIARLRKHVDIERRGVGATALSISLNDGRWEWQDGGLRNFRISGSTAIALEPQIRGLKKARGTVANGPAIPTPWNSVLSAEAIFGDQVGDVDYEGGNFRPSLLRWEVFSGESPLHYGWIVESSPEGKNPTKLTQFGRMSRGGLALTTINARQVLYFTDKQQGGGLYKFVSNSPDHLEEGNLYVADLSSNRWIAVTIANEQLHSFFDNNQEDLLLNLSVAGKLAGGTALNKPAGLAIDPANGDLLMALSNNLETQQYHGSVLRITDSGDSFAWDTEIEGSIDNGISCPGQLTFDAQGNLWIVTAIPAQLANNGVYTSFGNNGLFVIDKQTGELKQFASAPVDAKFGGISFSPDNRHMFLGVQQPGSRSTSIYDFDFTSHWPAGGKSKPESAVVVVNRK